MQHQASSPYEICGIAIIGAGSRGAGYASFAEAHPDEIAIAAVAEPNAHRREALASRYKIPEENVCSGWEELAARDDQFADAVVIATQDRMHRGPAIAFAERRYHLLLEKPMAPTAEECCEIVMAVKKVGILFAVAHVMRYTRRPSKAISPYSPRKAPAYTTA